MMTKSLWIRFFPIWILANVVGGFVNTAILITPYFGWKIPLSAAFILGLLQWVILNKFLSVDWRWALASMPVYGSLIYAFYFTANLIWFLFLEALIFRWLGWLQYKVLDEYTDRATIWIFISPLAGLLSFSIAFALFGYSVHLMNELLGRFWVVYGLAYGIITGSGLVLLMTKPQEDLKTSNNG